MSEATQSTDATDDNYDLDADNVHEKPIDVKTVGTMGEEQEFGPDGIGMLDYIRATQEGGA